MSYNETTVPHLISIGLTVKHFRLLEELARNDYHWLEAYLLIDAARSASLSTTSTKARTRISTIIQELDVRMYQRAWGIR